MQLCLCAAQVYSQYKEISTRKGVEILSQTDFLYACRMIDQQGFFNRKKSSKKSISWNDKVSESSKN
jgi:Cdc6-like AAA superfamily ATPase